MRLHIMNYIQRGAMKKMFFTVFLIVFIALSNNLLVNNAVSSTEKDITELIEYLIELEDENGIDYISIQNTTAYIPSMCYTKIKDETYDETRLVHNPCYTCHSKGIKPNYINDLRLQAEYEFPIHGFENRWKNLFTDKTDRVRNISDDSILEYIREDNYFTKTGEIYLSNILNSAWTGYTPDCYFNFDEEGFDKNPKTGEYTGWRAFRYYPFVGTFWPVNGSTDDVMIRLPAEFMEDENGAFNIDIYKINLAIIESLIKQRDIYTESLNESIVNRDLDGDGKIGTATLMKYVWTDENMYYAGNARKPVENEKNYLAGGLYPVGTEFLHTVRYVDIDDKDNVQLSPRMKEVRYSKKTEWLTYSDLRDLAYAEAKEIAEDEDIYLESFYGNFVSGMQTGLGWSFQGFIEGKNGKLRPQTNEETLFCMGCHSGMGAMVDSTLSFQRKMEGSNKEDLDYGWGHWSQKGLDNVNEPRVEFKEAGVQYEYSFYLMYNKAGDELRENKEVLNKFFDSEGNVKPDMLEKLHKDITELIYPSRERALMLNKAYKVIVEDQSYINGRDATVERAKNVHDKLKKDEKTGVTSYLTTLRYASIPGSDGKEMTDNDLVDPLDNQLKSDISD